MPRGLRVSSGWTCSTANRALTTCVVETDPPLRVVSVYVPHGREVGHWHYEYKLEFLDALTEQVGTGSMPVSTLSSPVT